jgi:hypothetical protein
MRPDKRAAGASVYRNIVRPKPVEDGERVRRRFFHADVSSDRGDRDKLNLGRGYGVSQG